MPYIPSSERENYNLGINYLVEYLVDKPHDVLSGHLNYVIFCLAKRLCKSRESYARMALISSAMGEAQAEFRRRILAPYEDEKISLNGDVS